MTEDGALLSGGQRSMQLPELCRSVEAALSFLPWPHLLGKETKAMRSACISLEKGLFLGEKAPQGERKGVQEGRTRISLLFSVEERKGAEGPLPPPPLFRRVCEI